MPIEFTARHMDAPEQMKSYAITKAEILVEEFPRAEHIHIVVDHEKHRYTAEVIASVKGHASVEGSEVSDNVVFSVDKAFEKVESQLRKLADKTHDHKIVMKHTEQSMGC